MSHLLPWTVLDFMLLCRRLFAACRCVTPNVFAVDVIFAGSDSLVVCSFHCLSSQTIFVHYVTNFCLLQARLVRKLSVFVVTCEHVLKTLCNLVVYHTGILHPIFQVRRFRAYKNEHLYIYVDRFCRIRYSFRSSYDSYHNTSTSASAFAKITESVSSRPVFGNTDSTNRLELRRSSEVFSLFFETLDVYGYVIDGTLFSCRALRHQCVRRICKDWDV